jgi:hypothetical protein
LEFRALCSNTLEARCASDITNSLISTVINYPKNNEIKLH